MEEPTGILVIDRQAHVELNGVTPRTKDNVWSVFREKTNLE